jgi:hypothetical protein
MVMNLGVSLRCREFIDKLRKYELAKKYSAAWSED